MKCVSCNYENQEGAKFCRSCGAKLELSAIVKQTVSMAKCNSCGSNNVASAKFCAKCGKKMTAEASPIPAVLPSAPRESEPAPVRTAPAAHQARTAKSDAPVSPPKVAPSRKGIYVSIAIVVALIAIGGGSYFVIQQREEQRLAQLEKEKKAQAEREAQQRALAAAEQARKQAEEQAAKLVQQKEEAEAKQKELEAQRREAELNQREAEVKRQAADVKRRESEAKRVELEAQAKRMDLEAKEREAAAARARQKATASVPSPAPQAVPQTAPRVNTPQRVTVQQACANRGNVFARGICEATECMKSANYNDPICVRGRETAEKNR